MRPATDKQKSAIIGMVYHHSSRITGKSDTQDYLDEIENLTGVTVDSWENIDIDTASLIISKLKSHD